MADLLNIQIRVRDANLELVGDLTTQFEQITWTSKHLAVGQWQITVPSNDLAAIALRTPGAGIVITAPDPNGGPPVTVLSGPTRTYRRIWTAAGTDQVIIGGVDDNDAVASRVIVPADRNQDTRTGTGGVMAAALINAHAGPSTPRAVPGLASVAAPTMTGLSTTRSWRYTNLLDAVRQLGLETGFTCNTVHILGVGLVCTLAPIVDRSEVVAFSAARGNLASFEMNVAASTASHTYTGGPGEGANRAVEIGVGDTIWGRREAWRDRRDVTAGELSAAAAAAALDARTKTGVKVGVLDSAAARYSVDFNVGDIVEVDVDDIAIVDTVTAATVTLSHQQISLTITVGDGEQTGAAAIWETIRRAAQTAAGTARS